MGNVKKGWLCLHGWLFYEFQEWIPLFMTRKQGRDILCLTLLEDEQSFHMLQDTRGSKHLWETQDLAETFVINRNTSKSKG